MSIQPIVPVEAITDVARAAQSGQSSQVNFSDWVSDQINTTEEGFQQVMRMSI
jgi:hypothetical protein